MTPTDLAALMTSSVPILGDALGIAADADMYAREPESRTGLNYLLSAAGILPGVPAAAQVVKPFRAFHGSGADFDKFDRKFMGTGEGAQAYGEGTYLSETEEVAKNYRDSIAKLRKDYTTPVPKDSAVAELENEYGFSDYKTQFAALSEGEEVALDEVREALNEMAEYGQVDEIFHDLQGNTRYVFLDGSAYLITDKGDVIPSGPNPGRMYEVLVHADRENFLKYDAPLDQQPEAVRKAYGKFKSEYPPEMSMYVPSQLETDQQHFWRFAKSPKGIEYLMDEGVQGTEYADAFTRHKSPDKQTKNFVIFDPEVIEISKKYGVSAVVAAEILRRGLQDNPEQYLETET